LDSREVVYKYRLSKWTAIIRECRSSGQTVAVWCSEHNINQKTYYYWLKRKRIIRACMETTLELWDNSLNQSL
jgi:hypothetical protein